MDEYETKLNEMSAIFKALSDKNRLTIIWLLASNTKKDVSVNDIADYLKISQPAASQHLKILKDIKILDSIKKGYFVYYNIDQKNFKLIKDKIDSIYLEAYKKC